MTDTTPDRQRFHELLPFYVNGTLDQTERQWLDAYLAGHPEAAQSVQFDTRLREVVQATHSSAPEQQRLEKLMREFHAAYPRQSFFGRLADWFAHPHRVPGTAIAFAMDWFAHPHRVPAPTIAFAMVLVAVQGVALLGMLPKPGEEEVYRGVTVKCEDGPRIRVKFKPQARHDEVLLLLRQFGLTVTAGPTETGDFWVKLPDGSNLDEKIAMLKKSTIVEEAIKSAPPGKECQK